MIGDFLKRALEFYQRRRMLVIIVLLILITLNGAYLILFSSSECSDSECFLSMMGECKRASYVREKGDIKLEYTIKGESVDKMIINSEERRCLIDVEMIDAKTDGFGTEKSIGSNMECYYPIGFKAYPEEDMLKCTGKLRENIQQIILEKVHKLLIENVDQIEESIKGLD